MKKLTSPNIDRIMKIVQKEIDGIEHGVVDIKFHIRDFNISRITLNREQSILAKEFFTDI
jgi:hypothetical protein